MFGFLDLRNFADEDLRSDKSPSDGVGSSEEVTQTEFGNRKGRYHANSSLP